MVHETTFMTLAHINILCRLAVAVVINAVIEKETA